MATFSYTVMAKDGKHIKGKLEANDKDNAISMLKQSGYYPLDVSEVTALQRDIIIGNPIKVKDLVIFCQQFEAILSAGVSILEALDLLREQTEKKFFAGLIDDMYSTVEEGQSVSQAMKKHKRYFPSILINMIEAGEASGSLEVALNRMADHFEREHKLKQTISKAVMYPIIVSIIAVGVIVLLLVVVIPTFVDMFNDMGMELPWTTKFLIGLSEFIILRWYIILGVVIIAVASYAYYSRTEQGKMALSAISLKIPVVGKVSQKVISSRFARTLSTLLASGLNLLEAIEIVAKVVDNYKVEKGLMQARDEVANGVPLSKPIREMGIFPPMITHMVTIGENTGQLESILNKVANLYDDEVETAVAQMTSLLEPLIIVVLAIVVGFVIISIVMPMFQMYNGLGNL